MCVLSQRRVAGEHPRQIMLAQIRWDRGASLVCDRALLWRVLSETDGPSFHPQEIWTPYAAFGFPLLVSLILHTLALFGYMQQHTTALNGLAFSQQAPLSYGFLVSPLCLMRCLMDTRAQLGWKLISAALWR